MSGNAVGFGFQADVTNTGSLLHTLTGRALKAMSDGGVDFYSIIAAITLGKDIIVREPLGDTVRSHIMSKGGLQAVLSKALSIGWGHKGLAVEMANTKAGTNALLLIGAIATGSNNYQVAQCFSELLSLRGCEPDRLPNVDVLKHMIGYLAPFVYDLGFSKVFENVTTTAIHMMKMMKIETSDYYFAYDHLTIHGDAAGVAGGINQLLLTSQKGESHYFVTRMRGAWFAAFSAHILGMAVELRLNDTVIWASAGNSGTAIFELGEHQISELSVQTISSQRIELVDSPDSGINDTLAVEYLVGEMFESLIAQEPRIDPAVWEGVRRGICQITSDILIRYLVEELPKHTFKHEDALKETLEAFGFDATTIVYSGESWPKNERDHRCLRDILDDRLLERLAMNCVEHGKHPPSDLTFSLYPPGCICTYADDVISALVESIMNFMWCRFDAKSVKIPVGDIGYSNALKTRWLSRRPKTKEIMANIMMLTCGDSNHRRMRWAEQPGVNRHLLGFSGSRYTVGFTFLLQNDCYDNQGRFISLWPGRASVDNVTRPVIAESLYRYPPTAEMQSSHSTVAPGSFLEPHYCPSYISTHMRVSLDEKSILVHLLLGPERSLSTPLPLARTIMSINDSDTPRCPHDPKAKYRVKKDQSLSVNGFYSSNTTRPVHEGNVIQLFALHGNKLEQALMVGCIGGPFCIIQTLGCLECCISAAENSKRRNVIMGG